MLFLQLMCRNAIRLDSNFTKPALESVNVRQTACVKHQVNISEGSVAI